MTLLALVAAAVAVAADWPVIQGTERGQADQPARPFGFVQVVGEGVFAHAVDGRVPTFDRLGTGDAALGLSVRRARLGLRGSVPATDQRLTWLVSLEAGTGSVTRTSPVVLSDASVTFVPTPPLCVRVGRFKLPLGDEALESNPVAAPTIDASVATLQLLQENPIAEGAYTGGASGYRDLGVSAFGSMQVGPLQVSYDTMVSNGEPALVDPTTDKDLSARVTVAYVLSGAPTDPHRHELALSAWAQRGGRNLEGQAATRLREGVGLHLETAPFRARAELIRGVGMIEAGPNPPFPGEPVVVYPDGVALGGYVLAHGAWRWAGATARWDTLRRGADDPTTVRVFQNWTFGVDATVAHRVRLLVDYTHRRLDAPRGDAAAARVAAAMGDRVAAQLGVTF